MSQCNIFQIFQNMFMTTKLNVYIDDIALIEDSIDEIGKDPWLATMSGDNCQDSIITSQE